MATKKKVVKRVAFKANIHNVYTITEIVFISRFDSVVLFKMMQSLKPYSTRSHTEQNEML